MKIGTLMALTLFVSASLQAAGNTTVQLRDVEGEIVEIAASKIEQAYQAILQGGRVKKNAKSHFVNDDGSVTLNEPFYSFNGKGYPFMVNSSESSNQACQVFGFEGAISDENGTKEKYTEAAIYDATDKGFYISTKKEQSIAIRLTCKKLK